MKKFLLPENGNFYKANLHCHSTLSDGRMSVEEIKKLYKENGYSIVAFTDHDVFIPHNDLTDENFLALNGYEWEIYEGYPEKTTNTRTFHSCLIAKNDKMTTPVCYHREKYFIRNGNETKKFVKFDESKPDFERTYSAECVNEFFKQAKQAGFYSVYNHPTWSGETYKEYSLYHGMDAFEIYNHECNVVGFDEYNPRAYDDLLRNGNRIACVAADDNHAEVSALGGFVMFKCDKLDYPTVISALEKGDFYASNGPLIQELFIEDGILHVKTTPASMITSTNQFRRVQTVNKIKCGHEVCEAQFNIFPTDGYVRITVTDQNGKHANTRAFFIDELL